MTINWLLLCLIVLIHDLIMHPTHMRVMILMHLTCVMRKTLFHLMRHMIQNIGWMQCRRIMMQLSKMARLLVKTKLVSSGLTRSNRSQMVALIATRLGLLQKGMLKRRVLTLMRLLHPLAVWPQFAAYVLWKLIMVRMYISWILRLYFLTVTCMKRSMYRSLVGLFKKGKKRRCACLRRLCTVWNKPLVLWYEKIHSYLIAHGFCNSPTESILYVKKIGDVFLVIILYVNDMLLTKANEDHIFYSKAELNSSFEMFCCIIT